jgi:hypothetical protein
MGDADVRAVSADWAAFFCRGVGLETGQNTKQRRVGGGADVSKHTKTQDTGAATATATAAPVRMIDCHLPLPPVITRE